jgi:hypothetical protein
MCVCVCARRRGGEEEWRRGEERGGEGEAPTHKTAQKCTNLHKNARICTKMHETSRAIWLRPIDIRRAFRGKLSLILMLNDHVHRNICSL